MISSGKQLKSAVFVVFASFILLFFILRIFVFSSFHVCFRHLLLVDDLTRLSPIPVTQGFVFHGP